MAVFRIEKTRDYTVMSNYHLRDMSLSLKAKGLLSLMLSLPENWDYTMEQEIIFLYYFQRLTHREIGRRYGRAGNTTGGVFR